MKIPKVFHSVWVQGSLPDEYLDWHRSWLLHHPGWEHVLWSEPDYLPHVSDCNRDIYATAVNHAQRAEIVQKELLLRFGGVWIDADFECFKNIEELIEDCEAFIGEETPGGLSAGIIGMVPNHPVMQAMVDDITPSIKKQRADGSSQSHGTGPYMWRRHWDHRSDFERFPPPVFYPYTWDDPKPETYSASAYAAHHWKATWKQ
jgi:mannosyltransferase OCH1-like enzyme